jgi:hypothetical protein
MNIRPARAGLRGSEESPAAGDGDVGDDLCATKLQDKAAGRRAGSSGS